MEALWTPGEVGKVDIPPGLVLSYVAEQGKQGSIEWGKGDACEKKSCHGMQKAKVKMDLLLALRQLKDAGESRPFFFRRRVGGADGDSRADPGKEIIADFPSLFDWPSNAVTLVTQFTVGRLPRFERTLREWDGPVSFTIYLTDAIDIVKLEKYLVSSPTILERWQTFALTIVKPDYSVSQEALTLRLRYPINKLRNLALVLAPTHYVLNVDVDFVPSPNMHHLLQSRGVPLIRHGLAGTSSSPTLRRTAIAISAFALSPSYTGEYPSTPSSLAAALYASPPLATLTDPNAGHGPSLPSLLFHLPFLSSPPRPPLPPTQATWSYSITYEPQWEPYYLLHRASHPLYDERFTDQGGDKQSHALVLNALGYEFRMLRDVWFMHPPKGVKVVVASDSEESEEEEDGDEWPSARLIDPEQEERGDDKDHDPSHFNSVAQRDQRRFRYFQDWLPEVQEVWGANVRWPRGAGAREVARGRNFGRGRAGTVFGI